MSVDDDSSRCRQPRTATAELRHRPPTRMKRASLFSRRREGLDVTMTPMIDVVFLLLVFFVWTASFQIVEQVLPSQLSAAAGNAATTDNEPPPPDADFDEVVIEVGWNGSQPTWLINDDVVESLAAVRERLRLIASIKADAPIFVLPDPAAPMLHVIDVYDAARLERFEKVKLAIRQPAP